MGSGMSMGVGVIVTGAVKRGPVIDIRLLVVVIVGVVITLPDVGLGVDLVRVDFVVHVDMCKAILQLGVVVIGDGSEGVEQIGINLAELWHVGPF